MDVGECILTKLEDGRPRVDRADPRILISAELLWSFLDDPERGVTLAGPFSASNLTGGLLRIEAVNQTVVYRIGEKIPDRCAYYAEWPD